MKKLLFIAAAIIAISCTPKVKEFKEISRMQSPDGGLEVCVGISDKGEPVYSLSRKGEEVILPSRLGYTLMDGRSLNRGFKPLSVSPIQEKDETWNPVWGEESEIRNHYKEMSVTFDKEDGIVMRVAFRLYDEGLAFRYEFPMENKLTYFNIKEEVTEFAMTGDHTAWWIPGDYDTQEYNYSETRLSGISKQMEKMRIYNASQTGFSRTGVQTALQMKTDGGLYINIHEAAVLNYPTANLNLDPRTLTFRTWLTPDAEGIKGRLQAPCVSPWRTVRTGGSSGRCELDSSGQVYGSMVGDDNRKDPLVIYFRCPFRPAWGD